MNIITISIAAAVSYLIGAIPCGLLIGLSKGIDIRKVGSGNIGATNVTRSVSPLAGKICFFCDFLKGMLPALLAQFLIPSAPATAAIICGLASVVGHMFPIYLKFKGGKGVSTAAGAILALSPLALIGAALVWVITFFTSRYVSLASIFAATSMPVFLIVLSLCKVSKASIPEIILFILLAILTVLKHSSNIKRLREGTENRFDKKSK